jgi:hypothetical protein
MGYMRKGHNHSPPAKAARFTLGGSGLYECIHRVIGNTTLPTFDESPIIGSNDPG